MKKKITFDIFLTLGIIWVIGGLILYKNPAIWPIGFVFIIIGAIGRVKK